MYVGVIFFTYRNGKLPAYQVMRKIRDEFEVRELIKQIQRKQQVRSHAIAMRFDSMRLKEPRHLPEPRRGGEMAS